MECMECGGSKFMAQGYVLVTTPLENITEFSDLSNLDVINNPDTILDATSQPVKKIICDNCIALERKEVSFDSFSMEEVFEGLRGKIERVIEINREKSSIEGYEDYKANTIVDGIGMDIMDAIRILEEKLQVIEGANHEMNTEQFNDMMNKKYEIIVTD